jgi:hypothetical protein
LVGEYTEVESGKRADRPELAKAIEACRKQKAKLVIAKLDRLSRNLSFVAALIDSGVEFLAADNPPAALISRITGMRFSAKRFAAAAVTALPFALASASREDRIANV